MKRIIGIIVLISCLACSFSSCSRESEVYEQSFFVMDTVASLRFYGDNFSSDAVRELGELEKLWDVTNDESEIGLWNKDHSASLSEKSLRLIERSLYYCSETNGALDITMRPLSRLWGFLEGESFSVPQQDAIRQVLAECGFEKLNLSQGILTAPDEVQIDLGATAKGAAAGLVANTLKEKGATSFVISLGGNVCTVGSKPDGSAWKIGIRDPKNESSLVGTLSFHGDRSVVTSGAYQRYFEQDGKRYCHIIDPKTGHPVDNGVASVTVVCADGLTADALSTALFVMGKEKAIEFYHSFEQFEMILVMSDGSVAVTEGISSEFDADSAYHSNVTIIERGSH